MMLTNGMPAVLPLRSRVGIRVKFTVALGICFPVVAAVGILGLSGLASVREHATSLYHSQFTNTRSTAQLLVDLGTIRSAALDPKTSDPAVRRRLERRFEDVLRPRIEQRVRRLRASSDSPAESRELSRLAGATDRFLRLGAEVLVPEGHRDRRVLSSLAGAFAASNAIVNRLMRFEQAEAAQEDEGVEAAHRLAISHLIAAMVAALVVMLAAAGVVARDLIPRILRYSRFGLSAAAGSDARLSVKGHDELADLGRAIDRMAASNLENRAHHAREEALTHALEVTESEDDAHQVLCRHIERSVPGSEATVLKRGAADEPLKLIHARAGSTRHARLAGAPSRDCLAMRAGRQQSNVPGDEQLVACRLCGKSPGPSTCTPLVVGGAVMGSVLVSHETAPDTGAREEIAASVARAAPALANLRNLALAETRAATDALTQLPNQRALREALVRMAAQASRDGTELTAVLLDLDHFKQVNDTYGHAAGDHLLAALGSVLTASLRGGDLAGRYGGEEFLLLLPGTGREGGAVLAEKVRKAVSRIYIPGVDRPITASLGVASLPADANDADGLVRLADRAMYAAKAAGRNRVEAFDQPQPAGPVHPAAGAHLAA